MVFQILSGFSLKLIVFSENKQGNTIPCQKNIVALTSTYKKINKYFCNLLTQRLPLGAVLEMAVLSITKKYLKNIHQASSLLNECFFQG